MYKRHQALNSAATTASSSLVGVAGDALAMFISGAHQAGAATGSMLRAAWCRRYQAGVIRGAQRLTTPALLHLDRRVGPLPPHRALPPPSHYPPGSLTPRAAPRARTTAHRCTRTPPHLWDYHAQRPPTNTPYLLTARPIATQHSRSFGKIVELKSGN